MKQGFSLQKIKKKMINQIKYEQIYADIICADRATAEDPPPNIHVATSAQRG
jgi:hypothetical protein